MQCRGLLHIGHTVQAAQFVAVSPFKDRLRYAFNGVFNRLRRVRREYRATRIAKKQAKAWTMRTMLVSSHTVFPSARSLLH
jgi:hypothetical protein